MKSMSVRRRTRLRSELSDPIRAASRRCSDFQLRRSLKTRKTRKVRSTCWVRVRVRVRVRVGVPS